MTYKLELFLVIQKKAHKYKIIQKKKFMVYLYWTPHFYSKLTHLTQKSKKFRLNRTHGTKLNSNSNPIFVLN